MFTVKKHADPCRHIAFRPFTTVLSPRLPFCKAYSLNGSNGNALVHPPVNDSEHEFKDMQSWPYLRLLRAGQQKGAADAVPLELLAARDGGSGYTPPSGWSAPCYNDTATAPGGGGGGGGGGDGGASVCRVDFSNVCYFFGRNIFATLSQAGKARPVGLIGTYWGGTADELWSSPDALRKCLDPSKPIPAADSSLWYGMISPLLNVTIKGAIWYQGEADSRHPGGTFDAYNCTFPEMIADWRSKWAEGSDTRPDFPFGFVQLNSIGNATTYDGPADPGDDLSADFGYAGLRWSQTASYGTVPNPAMPNVFMAVSLDTPDRPYPVKFDGGTKVDPGFNVHSPFKQPVAARLARAALPLIYGMPVDSTGPVVDSVSLSASTNEITVTVKNLVTKFGGLAPLRSTRGFEVSDGSVWHNVEARLERGIDGGGGGGSGETSLVLSNVPKAAKKVRYAWYSNPCGEGCFECAVYGHVSPLGTLSGMESSLPLAPFVAELR